MSENDDPIDAISTDAEAALGYLERGDYDEVRQLLRGIKAYADSAGDDNE